MYSLTYSFSYLEPVCCSMSSSNCCFLTCIQISQEAGQVVWYSHHLKNFPQFIVIHTVKGFGIVWFKIGKGVHQGCILSPCLFNLYAEYIMQNARLDEAQARIKIAGRNIITSDMQRHHPYCRKWRGTKESLDDVEREEWKSCLKTQHSKNKDPVPSLHGI